MGEVASFVGFPAAVISGVAYSQEIYDFVSTPDIELEAGNVSLRCAYAFRDPGQQRAFLEEGRVDVMVEVCDRAPLAVSFLAKIHNADSIARELKELYVVLSLPGLQRSLTLSHAREVEHLVLGVAETHVRRPWKTLPLDPNQTTDREIWFEPADESRNFLPYRDFRAEANELNSSLSGEMAELRVFGRVAGTKEPVVLAQCYMELAAAALERFRNKKAYRQIQFTAKCRKLGEAAPQRSS